MARRDRREALMQDRVEVSEVQRQLAAVDPMTVGELRVRYREVFDEDTRSRNRQYLIKKIKWRIQERAEGGLSELARRRIEELSRNAPIRRRLLTLVPTPTTPETRATPTAPAPKEAPITPTAAKQRDARLPPVGAVIRRAYNGATHTVRVLADGVEHQGTRYASLSGVARAITGTNWNGFLFFADALKVAGGAAKP